MAARPDQRSGRVLLLATRLEPVLLVRPTRQQLPRHSSRDGPRRWGAGNLEADVQVVQVNADYIRKRGAFGFINESANSQTDILYYSRAASALDKNFGDLLLSVFIASSARRTRSIHSADAL